MVTPMSSEASRGRGARHGSKGTASRSMMWLRRHMFTSPWHALLTLAVVYGVYLTIGPVVSWVFLDATWTGSSRADCQGEGACWAFIVRRFGQFIYGFYPEEQRWRVDVVFATLAAGVGALMIRRVPGKRWIGAFMVLAFPLVALWLLYGGALGLETVTTDNWGGLLLTFVFGVTGIVASLPIGILLALGRRSKLPVIRLLCAGFVEIWRGVPLITVLFMSVILLPLFLPPDFPYNELSLTLVGISIVAGAYIAEVVRGGLQSIPKGQYDAAAALGLGYWKATALVIMPQALRVAIPGIVNTSISVFKDSTLVMIIGLFDLLNIVKAGANDENWLGSSAEGYVFVAVVFWVFCFGFSQYSQRLEGRLEARRNY